ncbi:hypothetical protein Tco_0718865 [Tanacetum coccineum]
MREHRRLLTIQTSLLLQASEYTVYRNNAFGVQELTMGIENFVVEVMEIRGSELDGHLQTFPNTRVRWEVKDSILTPCKAGAEEDHAKVNMKLLLKYASLTTTNLA